MMHRMQKEWPPARRWAKRWPEGLETRKGTVANKMATVPFLCRRVRVPRIFHCDIVSKIFHLPLDKESFLYYHMNSYSYERM